MEPINGVSVADIYEILQEVKDPEIPVISIVDLGIVRKVSVGNKIEVVITPTYSGCPAMLEIEKNIRKRLSMEGYDQCKVLTELSPPWTTEWMTENGKKLLQAYGIAPPNPKSPNEVNCPHCKSKKTTMISQFGSTACKALYKCEECLEPFDYFKCH
ncbi:MAG: 1,2-phenylacetyl-CoA epoxidase subunit PaaD [Bacteroidota bacterium]